MNRWLKLGQIFEVESNLNELQTHASNPLPVFLYGNVFRIFYSGRNNANKSSVGYVDVDILTKKILNRCSEVAFKFGSENTFYSHGVSIGNVYQHGLKSFILFMGWNIQKNEHWRGDVGRLELINSHDLRLDQKSPILPIDDEDAISLSYPFVIFHNGIYKMWYGSTLSWTSENNEMIHVIKYATSKDGDHWEKHGVAVPFEVGVAQAFSKPSVIIDELGFHMWYSFRSGTGEKYRIGYAHSMDGISWTRKHNETGLDVSNNGWDSEMICYPFVFDHQGERYMLYNGNEYGKYGFGLAKLKN
jgi:hypothetical protein